MAMMMKIKTIRVSKNEDYEVSFICTFYLSPDQFSQKQKKTKLANSSSSYINNSQSYI